MMKLMILFAVGAAAGITAALIRPNETRRVLALASQWGADQVILDLAATSLRAELPTLAPPANR